MATSTTNPLTGPFLAAAEEAARTRPEVDLELARELMGEAATMLHDGLALDGLDEHDTDVAVAGLSRALVAPDPGAALREEARAAQEDPHGTHEPDVVAGAYLVAAAILRV
jgi:hypothetical protein